METLLENARVLALILLFSTIVIKNAFEVKKNSKTKMPFLIIAFFVTLLFVLIPVVVIITLFCLIYRETISFVLKLKHREKFLGLVRGADAVHAIDKPINSVTHILGIFEYTHDENNSRDFFELLKQIAARLINRDLWKLPKFQALFLKSMGYSYMLRDIVSVDECIRKMKIIVSQDEELNKTELMDLLSECYSTPLPRNETVFWDILVGTQSIKWKENRSNGIKYYPILFRHHHCVADGVALLKLWAGVFADKKNINLVYSEGYGGTSNAARYSHNIYSDINEGNDLLTDVIEKFVVFYKIITKIPAALVMGLYVFLLAPSSIVTNVFRLTANNILHEKPLIKQETLAAKTEEMSEYILKVKKIKSKIPGITFPEVLLAAFSASLRDFLQKNSSPLLEFITTYIPLVPGSGGLNHIVPGELTINDVEFQNSYCFVLLDLPVFIKDENKFGTPLINRLNLLKKQTDIIKNSVDYWVSYTLMTLITPVLPQPLVNFLLSRLHCTIAASIMPGPQKISYGNGVLPLNDFVFWIPHLKNIGVGFTAMTYDNKLQIGLGADKGLIPNQCDAQAILEGLFKYLNVLEEEINSMV